MLFFCDALTGTPVIQKLTKISEYDNFFYLNYQKFTKMSDISAIKKSLNSPFCTWFGHILWPSTLLPIPRVWCLSSPANHHLELPPPSTKSMYAFTSVTALS